MDRLFYIIDYKRIKKFCCTRMCLVCSHYFRSVNWKTEPETSLSGPSVQAPSSLDFVRHRPNDASPQRLPGTGEGRLYSTAERGCAGDDGKKEKSRSLPSQRSQHAQFAPLPSRTRVKGEPSDAYAQKLMKGRTSNTIHYIGV